MPSLRIQMLGGFSIFIEEVPVTTVTGGKMLTLLALLLLQRSPQSRKHISFLLWPDSSERQALTNLRKLFHHLRQALPDSDRYLRGDSLSLWWNDEAGCSLDIREFELATSSTSVLKLKEAIALYKGPLLPGCYDEWLDSDKARFAQMHQEALEQLISKLELAMQYEEARSYALLLLQVDPLGEAGYRTAMRLCALCGDLGGAAQIYQKCEDMLRQELGISPSQATKQAYESLKNVSVADKGMAVLQSKQTSPLVGRAVEWATVLSAWRKASGGKPHLLLISGEPGIGKTRLAQQFLNWADRQGVRTASAKCHDAEGGLAYAPITGWLRGIPLPHLEHHELSELTRFSPELRSKFPALPSPLPLTENWQLQHAYEALRKALVGRESALLMLDDIQWCDQASLDWLRDLLRHDHPQLVIAATVRSGDENEGLLRACTEWRVSRQLTDIRLAPLDAVDTKLLAEAFLHEACSETDVFNLHRETRGNPLFIIETLRTTNGVSNLPSPGSSQHSRIQHVILERFDKLPEEARTIIHYASVIGMPFPFQLMDEITGMSRTKLLPHVEQLCRKEILKPVGQAEYFFVHDKLKEAAYDSLSDVRRREYHRQIACSMEALLVGDPASAASSAAQIAHHYEQAGMARNAAKYYQQAANTAISLYAHESAIASFQKLMQLAEGRESYEALLLIAKEYEVIGKREEARSLYLQALADPEARLSLGDKARLQAALGNCLVSMGSSREALGYLFQARSSFELLEDKAGIAGTLAITGIVHYYSGQSTEALACFAARELIPAEHREPREDFRVAGIYSMIYLESDDEENAIAWSKQKLQIAERLDDVLLLSQALGTLGVVYNELERFDKLPPFLDERIRLARQTGEAAGITMSILGWANVFHAYAEYEKANCCYRYVITNARRSGDMRMAAAALGSFGHSFMHQGEWQLAYTLLEQSVALLRKLDSRGYLLIKSIHYLALLHRSRGQLDQSLQAAEEALGMAEALNCKLLYFSLRMLILQLRSNLKVIDRTVLIEGLIGLADLAITRERKVEWKLVMRKLGATPAGTTEETVQELLQLYAESPKEQYRQWIYEWTGERMTGTGLSVELPTEAAAAVYLGKEQLVQFVQEAY